MLHHEALRQLTHDLQLQRRRDGEAERLATQARSRHQQRRKRSALDAVLELLRRGRAPAPIHGA